MHGSTHSNPKRCLTIIYCRFGGAMTRIRHHSTTDIIEYNVEYTQPPKEVFDHVIVGLENVVLTGIDPLTSRTLLVTLFDTVKTL